MFEIGQFVLTKQNHNKSGLKSGIKVKVLEVNKKENKNNQYTVKTLAGNIHKEIPEHKLTSGNFKW